MIATGAFVAFSLYELISFPLYVRIIYILCRKAEFNNPFYRLICLNGIFDVCHCVITILFYRLPMFSITFELYPKSPSRLISLVIVCYFSLIYQIFFLHFAVSLNRLTGIFAPFKHKMFWEKWWPAAPAIGFALSIGLTFHRIFSTGQYIAFTGNCVGFTPVIVKYDLYSVNQNLLTAIFGSFSLLSCLVFNCATLAKILQRKRANKNLHQNFKNEIHLFIVSFWMMLFMCIFITFELALWTSPWLPTIFKLEDNGANLSCFLFAQLPWVEDLFSLSQPWVLVMANKSIRRLALPFSFSGEKIKPVQVKSQQIVTVMPRHPTILLQNHQYIVPRVKVICASKTM